MSKAAPLQAPPCDAATTRACHIRVEGIVQGVGFRPFVYRLARRFNLAGEVANTSAGVSIFLEGTAAAIDGFVLALRQNPPPLALIAKIGVAPSEPRGLADFRIAASRDPGEKAALISPDVATCEDCRRELFDPADRRYRYPFINCTNCGPRYTIIDAIPYDRPNTAMRDFILCPQCQAEYDDPNDRRFHAQPNACPRCGPRLRLCDAAGEAIRAMDPIAAAAQLLRQGLIVAVKGLGGFHLAVDAYNEAAVTRLRARKRREEKPLAIMCPDLAMVRALAELDAVDEALLSDPRRPIALLQRREPAAVAAAVAPDNRYLGVLLPYTPLHHLLLAEGFRALVMTSANLSEEPIAADNDEALQRLAGIADAFLLHDRAIRQRCDDSIVRQVAGGARLVRRSRGYVPVPVFLRQSVPPLLACGAELKSTICLARGERAFVSQHLGDLENAATLEFFEASIRHLQRLLEIAPEALAHDRHPDYLSTRWALGQGLPCIAVQHHHAHIAACLAENRHPGPAIGLALDGSGYGPDGTLWGGEVLLADLRGFRRLAHFAPVPLPGGAAAIREPWRMALSYLDAALGDALWELPLPPLSQVPRKAAHLLLQATRAGLNAPRTSSLGRLFDAVAALCGLRQKVAFEGQAAMLLEMVTDDAPPPREALYPLPWSQAAVRVIDTAPLIRAVVSDLLAGVPTPVIGARFHASLVRSLQQLCVALGRDTGLRCVALSGGVFQNARLLAGLVKALEQHGFTVLTHRLVPSNDGGISLGQAVVATAAMAAGLSAPYSE